MSTEYSAEEIHGRLLTMAKDFHQICVDNNLKYYMLGGTMLGAVRHKGFIPWDDDMDFGMLREDYEKFLSIAPMALDNKYFLQTWDNDPNYPFGFAKIRKKGTRFIEKALSYNTSHNELYIDLFPYDSFPDCYNDQRNQGRKIMKYKIGYLMKQNVKPWITHEKVPERILVFLKYIPSQIYALFHEKEFIKDNFKKEMTRFNSQITKRLYEQSGGAPYGKWVVDRDCFSSYIDLQFENVLFAAPIGYKKYLEQTYGDYMTLPPKDKRGNRHNIIEVKL